MCIIVTTDHTTAMTTRYRYRWEDARAAYLAGDLTIKEFHAARSREFSLSVGGHQKLTRFGRQS